MTDVLLWIDLETTGLDHTTGEILEVAVVPTTMDLDYILEYTTEDGTVTHGWHYVVSPTRDPVGLMSDEVALMHTESGLMTELYTSGAPIWWVDLDLEGRLTELLVGPPGSTMLAGTGIAQFDIHWIRAHMPRLADQVSYRTIDVGQIRRFAKHVMGVEVPGVADINTAQHRAMPDAVAAVEQARWFKHYLTVVLEGEQ